MRTVFEAVGFECTESQNGALAVAEAERLKPDIIVLRLFHATPKAP